MAKTRMPAVDGLFTMDAANPRLIGGKAPNGSYCFPKDLGGTDPYSPLGAIEEVELSSRGRIWSYVVPHPPLLAAYAAVAPYTVAVVELEDDPSIRLVGDITTAADAAWGNVEGATLTIGDAVQVCFGEAVDGIVLPRWVPA